MAELFALFIGISNYPYLRLGGNSVKFPQLPGATKDVSRIMNSFKKNLPISINSKVLLNENATKINIASEIISHLGKARLGDPILIYFSGHGTREYADEVFTNETDGKLECIVCHFDSDTKNNCLLSDKEINYLIYKLDKKDSHILTIFDCCHSAGISRNVKFLKSYRSNLIEKRIDYTFEKRPWENFLFSSEFGREDFVDQKENFYNTKFFTIAACESNESAFEDSEEGVLTKSLLNVLRYSKYNLTYNTLINRIRQNLRGLYDQKPRLILPDKHKDLLSSTFLNFPLGKSDNIFEVTFNSIKGWILNVGYIQGMSNEVKECRIIDAENNKNIVQCTIIDISLDYCIVAIEANLKKTLTHKVILEFLFYKPINLFLIDSIFSIPNYDKLNEGIGLLTPSVVNLVDNEKDANYLLQIQNNEFWVSHPNERNKPLVNPLKIDKDDTVETLSYFFKHISRWNFIKSIQNQIKISELPLDTIFLNIELGIPHKKEEYQQVEFKDFFEPIIIGKENLNSENKSKIKIEVVNTSSYNIFCSVIYLKSDFSTYIDLLSPPVYHLNRGDKVPLKIGNSVEIDIEISKNMIQNNWEQITDYIKIISSTEDFDIRTFLLEEISELILKRSIDKVDKLKKSGFVLNKPNDDTTPPLWRVDNLNLIFKNPEFTNKFITK